MKPILQTPLTRRRFLRSSTSLVAGVALPQVVPASLLGAVGRTSPSNRITLGCIGVGGMGTWNMKTLLGQPDCQVLAVCDVSESRRRTAKEIVDAHYGNQDCGPLADWRELVARKDLDAVMIATPDHWHSLMAVAAARAGKDLYCEKPMGISLEDGQAIRDAVRQNQRVFQAGTWQRSARDFRFACELARNGYLGRIHTVEVATDGTKFTAGYQGPRDPRPAPPVPAGFDWKMWQGPAPERAYHPARHSGDWFMIRDYSVGWTVNWGVHHLDISLWGCPELGTGPFELESRVTWRNEGFTDTVNEWDATYTYANGLKLVFKDQKKMPTGCRFIGDQGWIRVDRQWENHPGLVAEPASLLKVKLRPDELHLYHSPNHASDFVACVRSRQDPISDVDTTHRASYLGLLTEVAGRLERKLEWDPGQEQFIGNDDANRMLRRTMHNGWSL
ncbi:MAG: Gfo/Idh/MocA family protein [Limisphaerales bacterium]